jgi:hypothetical protein
MEAAAVGNPDTPGVNSAPTLVVDANRAAAEQLAQQLKHAGFSTEPHETRALFLRYGVDALIVTPFSMEDLISRLTAFSCRSRPLS